jgi:hypothetical protein
MKARWADPDQAARMKAGLAKGHRTIAAKLDGGSGDAGADGGGDPAPSSGATGGQGIARSGGGIGSIFTASPRDLLDRILGRS